MHNIFINIKKSLLIIKIYLTNKMQSTITKYMINNDTLSEIAYKRIKQDILTGVYAPKERLLIEKVSEKLGVSMTPLKDAFRILEKEGLVQNIPRRGTFVTEISDKDIIEFCQIRLALESLAIDLTIKHGFDIPKSEINELRAINKKVAKALKNKDKKDFITFDIQFHLKIVSFSKNTNLEKMLEHFPLSNFLVVMGGGIMSSDDGEQIVAQHEHIIEALENKDKGVIKELIEKNIFTFHSQLLGL